MYRRVSVIFYESFADYNSIFKVVTFPWHKSDKYILSQRKLSQTGGRPICQHLSLLNLLTGSHDRLLINARILIRPFKLGKVVCIETDSFRQRFIFLRFLARLCFLSPYYDTIGINILNDSWPFGKDYPA